LPRLYARTRRAGLSLHLTRARSWLLLFSRLLLAVAGRLVARQRHALPWRQEIEVAERLWQLHLLVRHALLLGVVPDLDMAREREVLAQRESLEPVVGEEPAQVRMPGKQDPVHVERLALEPVRARKDPDDARNRRLFVGL